MNLGRAIREIRLSLGLTQLEVAARLDMPGGNLSTIECHNKPIHFFTLECIATAMGVKVSDIILKAESYQND